jgi:hypothetical protein
MEQNVERTVLQPNFGNLLITLANLALLAAQLALELQMDYVVLAQLVSLTYLEIALVPSTLALLLSL